MELTELLQRILLAALLGGIIGLERDMHGRAAGLRTHLLVSMGAALFTVLSELIATHATAISKFGAVAALSDPGRIAAQVVTGIGFLGAGTIIKEGLTIRGLTTAACLWFVAAIGMAAGSGYFMIAVTTTIVGLFSLISLHYLERIYPKDSYRILKIETGIDLDPATLIEKVTEKNVKVVFLEMDKDYEQSRTIIKLHIHIFHKGLTDVLADRIISKIEQSNVPVNKIAWSRR